MSITHTPLVHGATLPQSLCCRYRQPPPQSIGDSSSTVVFVLFITPHMEHKAPRFGSGECLGCVSQPCMAAHATVGGWLVVLPHGHHKQLPLVTRSRVVWADQAVYDSCLRLLRNLLLFVRRDWCRFAVWFVRPDLGPEKHAVSREG